MNHYTLSEMKEGLTESFDVIITADMMEKFLLSDFIIYIHGANLNVCNGGGHFN